MLLIPLDPHLCRMPLKARSMENQNLLSNTWDVLAHVPTQGVDAGSVFKILEDFGLFEHETRIIHTRRRLPHPRHSLFFQRTWPRTLSRGSSRLT